MTSVDVRVAEIAARAEAASEGPWFREYGDVTTGDSDEDGECRWCGRPFGEHETPTWKFYERPSDD